MRPGPEHEVRHRGDAGQRLTTKPERANGREILWLGDLAGRMPLDRQPRILRLHTDAVVFNANQLLPAQLHCDGD